MFKKFLFHRWTKTILWITNIFLGTIFLFSIGAVFRYYGLDTSFLFFIFLLILGYFYYLFTNWLIRNFSTYSLDPNQFSQILQTKKLVAEGQDYQVEKITNLKIRFNNQLVIFQGSLIIPQEDGHLILDFSTNATWDYYQQQLLSSLQTIPHQISERKFSWTKALFHSILLGYFLVYLFWIIPIAGVKAFQKKAKKESGNNDHIQDEGSGGFSSGSKTAEFRQRLRTEPFPPKVKAKIEEKIRQIESRNPFFRQKENEEQQLEKIMEIPWYQTSKEVKDLKLARKKMDEAHHGLEKVKQKILNHLAVQQITGKSQGRVLCLVGHPGTGKTTFAKVIAEVMGRKFVRISLNGVHDEGEIRGHRPTYISARPGMIAEGLVQAKVKNPVIFLDEVDKASNVTGHHGNVSAALLTILDPEQNFEFRDNYIEIPIDLSQAFFVCAANNLRNIPAPLRDRMTIIQLPSYTTTDKFQIAQEKLIPKILTASGLDLQKFTFTTKAIKEIINYYDAPWKGGIRGLEQLILTITDALAYKVEAEALTSETIDIAEIRKYLGSRKFEKSDSVNYGEPGIVNGLAYAEYEGEGSSGDVLPIEVSYSSGEGKLKLTGNLGETMKESAEIALEYVKKNCSKFGISDSFFQKNNIFINVHESGIPKDGPSAGIALTTAIISALTEKVIPSHCGMTGVISLSGKVSKIGGLNEKLTAAAKKDLKTVFIPSDNEQELEDVPLEIKSKLNVFYADDYFSSVWKRIS